MSVAETILQQLGGNRFLAMTGCNHLVGYNNAIRMVIPRNASKANRLHITLEADDTYTMRFFYYRPGRLNTRTGVFIEAKTFEVKLIKGVYCDMLQDIFTDVTKMYTHL